MKRIVLSALILAAASPPDTLSYCQSQGPQSQAPFSIHISTPQPVVVAGTPVTIHVSLTNTSNQPMTAFRGDDPFCPFQIDIHDAGNKRAKMTEARWNLSGEKPPADDNNDYHDYRHLMFGSMHIMGFPLKPGQTSETSCNLSRLYILGPGEYIISFWHTDAARKATVKSNTLTITVNGATK